MPNTSQKTCPNCNTLNEADVLFCGGCGHPFPSGTNYPTKIPGGLQQGPRTPVLSSPTHPFYTPDPTLPASPQPLYPFPNNGVRGKNNVWRLTALVSALVVAILLVVVIFQAGFQAGKSANSQVSTTGNVQTTATAQPGTGVTSIPATQPATIMPTTAPTPTPTPTDTPTPTPTATPVPVKAGTVICANNFSAWGLSGNWQVVGGTIVHETTNDYQPLLAPCNIPNNNYTVEVQIRAGNPSTSNYLKSYLGVIARAQDSSTGYEATIYGGDWEVAPLGGLGTRTQALYYPGTHTLKLTVKGTEVIFNADGNTVYDDRPSWATTYAGYAGIMCSDSCEILDFKVIAV